MENSIINPSDITSGELMAKAGQAANHAASRGVFADYKSRKAANTLRRETVDLAAFAAFLKGVGLIVGDLFEDPKAWHGITWGLVAAFQRDQLKAGFAVSTVNFRLSTIKVYAGMAALAGALDHTELALIKLVKGYAHKEGKRIDENRQEAGNTTRKGAKKAEAVSISPSKAKALKTHPNTPQGRRDSLLMCLLLDHGLRCGEAALLQVENIDLKTGELRFYRPKVDKIQTHRLTKVALEAAREYLENDNTAGTGDLFLGSIKGGKLGGGMSERAITKRVAALGLAAGLPGLSAHDCRHYWATQAVRNGTPLDRLQDAGGWTSLSMPMRYCEAAKIANSGVNLGTD